MDMTDWSSDANYRNDRLNQIKNLEAKVLELKERAVRAEVDNQFLRANLTDSAAEVARLRDLFRDVQLKMAEQPYGPMTVYSPLYDRVKAAALTEDARTKTENDVDVNPEKMKKWIPFITIDDRAKSDDEGENNAEM